MKKNETIQLEITDVTAEGNGVGHYENMAVFVPNLITGDVAEVKIVKVLKNYCFGINEKIIKKSEHRIESECPVSEKCGGCTFRNMSYDAQLEMKQKIVSDAFKRIGKFEIEPESIISSENINYYRNKAQYPVAEINGKIVCGFYAKRSHRVVPYTDCKLQDKAFSEIVNTILELLNEKRKISAYNEENNTGILRHIYLRRGYHSGEIMVCFVVRKNVRREIGFIVRSLTEKYPDIKSIVLNINPIRTNVIMGKENVLLWGKETIQDTMCGVKFDISPLSFYQVNTPQAEILYDKAKEFACPKNTDTLLDFYCGAGTIGLSMADSVAKLTGIEIIPDAVENAKSNAEMNGFKNAEFICSDSGNAAKMLIEKGTAPNIITVDPPRKGCDAEMLDAMITLNPEKIVMISCNPSTAARDCKILCERGYKLEKYQPVDLFPFTGHIETVVLMSKIKA